MTIEFKTPYGKVTEKLINSIRAGILELKHINETISKAEVLLREETGGSEGSNKICEATLNIYGDDLLVRTRAESFENSAEAVLKELRRMVRQKAKTKEGLPDQILTSVKV